MQNEAVEFEPGGKSPPDFVYYIRYRTPITDDDNIYTIKNYNSLKDIINDLDYTVFNPEFRIENNEI